MKTIGEGQRRIGHARTLTASVLGMIVVATPLAMWVAWTGWMFVGALFVGVAAAALHCALDQVGVSTAGEPHRSPETVSPLDDGIVAELSNLQPFVYHNRLSAERRLQSTLDKIKERLSAR